jgi:di/tricarboxylate transporter
VGSHLGPEWALGILLVSVMLLSDLVNNAAAAALSAPIGLRAAIALDVSPDAFLMAVAIGASCTFLTPIGHQSNTLVMGPGGYRFTDYWKVGLPMDILIVSISLPALLYFWPLQQTGAT